MLASNSGSSSLLLAISFVQQFAQISLVMASVDNSQARKFPQNIILNSKKYQSTTTTSITTLTATKLIMLLSSTKTNQEIISLTPLHHFNLQPSN